MKLELFYTPVCPICPTAKKIVPQLLKKYPQVEYVEVNAFENQDRVNALKFRSVPAIVIDGKLWGTGLPNEKKLEKFIMKKLKKEGA